MNKKYELTNSDKNGLYPIIGDSYFKILKVSKL